MAQVEPAGVVPSVTYVGGKGVSVPSVCRSFGVPANLSGVF